MQACVIAAPGRAALQSLDVPEPGPGHVAPAETVQRREREYLSRLAPRRGGEVEIFSPPR